MITKLRRNFIIVAMCSTFTVLAVIVGALNVVSYANLVEKADAILDVLAENDARFPAEFYPFEKDGLLEEGVIHGEVIPEHLSGEWSEDILSEDQYVNEISTNVQQETNNATQGQMEPTEGAFGKRNPPNKQNHMSVETPYETRFFTVRMNDQGAIVTVDTGKIAAVKTEDAIAFAQELWESGKKEGFIDNYRYRMVDGDEENMIIFVDTTRELAAYRTLVNTSVSVSILGLLAVFVLVVYFSKKVFQPVAASYEKQKQFITDASHELKTPLTIISANVEILEMEGEENSWTKSIKNQVTRLTSLTEQMVTLSRMDEEGGEKDFQNFNLSDALIDTVSLFQPLAQSQEKELVIEVEDGRMYYGDEKKIRQMTSLLMDNAMKYSSDKGKIVLSLKQKGKKYQLSVWNTVEDIQTGNLDVLFERFYRLDSSRSSATGGSGIGLSIVKSIVENHGGKITAKSEDGKSIVITAVI